MLCKLAKIYRVNGSISVVGNKLNEEIKEKRKIAGNLRRRRNSRGCEKRIKKHKERKRNVHK